MSTCLCKCACGLVAGLASAVIFTGCSVIDSFKPEIIRLDDGKITIKGWVDEKKSEFCITIELKKSGETTTLHSLNLVRADGTKSSPHDWTDQTPRKAPPRISLGFGVGLGGRSGGERHGEGHDGGGDRGGGLGTVLRPGISVPLQKEKSIRSVTKVTACWTLESLKGDDVSKCDLEVNISKMSREKITVSTLTLAMGYHRDDEKTTTTDPPPKDDKQTAKDLISEIDFTQKGPVKTKTLDV
jgi:hypothetical protein